ncbi:MAG: tyrosine-type recombinase/integrase [Gemmatimonadota bacterium]
MNITTRWLRSDACKATSERRQTDFWDTNRPAGFGVRVSPLTGAKTFVVRYRAHGRRRCYRIGTYPDTKLAEARDEAREVLRKVRLGEDPALVRQRQARRAEPADAFGELADRFLEREPSRTGQCWRPKTRQERERIIEHELRPRWGDLRLDEITKAHIIDVMDEIEGRGAKIMANRVRSLIHAMLQYAVDSELLDVNPCSAVRKPVRRERTRDRVLTAAEIKKLWKALDDERPVIRALFRFQLLTGQRIGETLRAKWDEIDRTANLWKLPAANTKAGRAHRVPLSPQALAVLDEIRAETGGSEFVFGSPSDRSDGHAHQLWVTQRVRSVRERTGIKDLRSHDLRRTCGTGMRDAGAATDVIARVLGHADSLATPGATPIYIGSERWSEQVAALTAWGAEVDRILSRKPHEAQDRRPHRLSATPQHSGSLRPATAATRKGAGGKLLSFREVGRRTGAPRATYKQGVPGLNPGAPTTYPVGY